MRDPYTVLNVVRSAGADEIKKAYRKLARERHPDSDPGNPWAEDEFKELSAAYELLSDENKRAAYDRGEIDADGNRTRRGPRPGAGKRNPFENIFRNRAKGKGPGVKVKGADVSYTLRIDFVEAALGATKQVALSNGKRLDVKVPPGIEDGQTLRLKGQGTAGWGGAEAGDAHVEILVDPHPVFRRQGRDIHLDLAVTLQEAILGGKVETPTIDGKVSVTVPEGSNTGTMLRLRGKGLAENGSGRTGDQYVRLQVVLPSKPDKDLSAFVRKWAPKNAYEIRRTKARDV